MKSPTPSPISDKAAGELLPCPFCGSADISAGEILGYTQPSGEGYCQSACNACGANSPEAKLRNGEVDYGDEKSIAAWNRRSTAPTTGSAPEPLVFDDWFDTVYMPTRLERDRVAERHAAVAG